MKVKGKRRSRYYCCNCLDTVYEYSFIVMDRNAVRCADCQKQDGSLSDDDYKQLKIDQGKNNSKSRDG